MEIKRFYGGGFVLHNVPLGGYAGRFSCWFDAEGALLDAEQIRGRFYAAHPVKRGGLAWRLLEKLGPVYAGENSEKSA